MLLQELGAKMSIAFERSKLGMICHWTTATACIIEQPEHFEAISNIFYMYNVLYRYMTEPPSNFSNIRVSELFDYGVHFI